MSWDGVPVPGERSRTLLTALARAGGRVVGEEALVAALWGEDRPLNPAKALQVVVSRVRSATAPDVVVRAPHGYRLGLAAGDVDLWLQDRAVETAERAVSAGAWSEAERCLPHLEDAPVLAGRILAGLGRYDEALPLLEAGGAADQDSAMAALLRSLAAVQGVPAALRRYEGHRAHLSEQLGTDPSPDLQALHQELLLRDRPVRTGVSHYATSLVGREDDLTRLRGLVRSHRVVSILGPGGLGKTRLAQLVAAEAEQPVVHVVELVGVVDPDDVVPEVGSVLGVRDSVHGRHRLSHEQLRDVRARIAQQLDLAPTLLVLDNCEHLVDAVADLVAFLVAVTPSLRVVTTTRAPLSIAAEHVFELSRLGAADAARLFRQRAQAARPGVVLPEAAVQEVVERLDGLPLAIELAAVKVRAMAVEDIALRLENRFALLRGGDRSAPDRHQTLLAVIDWSWNLLDEDERRGLRCLSVFHDGFALPAAEAVVGGAALEVISELVAQSLLAVVDPGAGTPLRYRMLETVREFGRMQLGDAGEDGAALAAHRAWAVAFAEAQGLELFGRNQIAAVDALLVEENNLADALRRAIADGDSDAAVVLVSTMGAFWSIRGEHGRVILLVDGFVEALQERRASPARTDHARTALALSIINSWIARPTVVPELRELLVELGPESDSPAIAAIITVVLAVADTSEHAMARAAALADATDPTVRAVALQWLSHVRENEGDLAGSLDAAQRALADVRDDQGPWNEAVLHTQVAGIQSQLGHFDEARPHAEAAVPVLLRLGAHDDALQALAITANASLGAGDVTQAERIVEEIAHLSTPHSFGSDGVVLTTRGEVAFARGDHVEGCRLMREAADAMAAVRYPGMGPDADLAPWTLYGRSVAVVAYATHGSVQDEDGADIHAALVAIAPRLIERDRTFIDVPVIGLVLFALGAWALCRRTTDADLAVRMLVLAERLAYSRYTPTLAWERAVALCEERAPGLLASVSQEYGDRRGPVLLDEARARVARVARG